MSSAAFPGRLTISHNALLIIDLDGTLLTVNSFRVWVLYMLRGRLGVGVQLQAAWALVQRKIFCCSHWRIKQKLQVLWQQKADAKALEDLLNILQRKIRPNLRVFLAAPNTILATAALADYARPLAIRLGFTHIIASEDTETREQEKCDRVCALIAAQGWQDKKKILFTDHLDDLPLIIKSDVALWFGKEWRMPPYPNMIYAPDLSAEEMIALIN